MKGTNMEHFPEDPLSAEIILEETEPLAKPLTGSLSRRDLLRLAAGGTAGLLLSGLPSDPARAQLPRPPGLGALGSSSGPQLSTLQLPFLGDGSLFNQPEHYETIQAGRRHLINKTVQSADLDGDGQDELVARGPTGIVAYHFDPHVGQWIVISTGPAPFGDKWGWYQAKYYQTIQTADLDGDGKAEVLGRNGGFIEWWKYDADLSSPTYTQWIGMPKGPGLSDSSGWNQPQYYTTIQCADIDGDGQDELLARGGGGLMPFKYNAANQTWMSLPWLTAMSDSNGWKDPSCYETIQCADIDGDGKLEVIGRTSNAYPEGSGIRAWKYNGSSWDELAWGPGYSDGNGWLAPSYYQTIQFADIDGDGRDELMSREGGGTQVWKYGTDNDWHEMPYGPFGNSGGWSQPQQYQTIQCADIDGDGRDELLGRDSSGVQAWKYTPANQSWNQLAGVVPMPDRYQNSPDQYTSWSDVMHYATIQTARVFGDPTPQDLTQNPPVYPNANNPPVTDGNGKPKTVAVLLGRGFYSLQTWRYNPNSTQQLWNQSSAPFPTYVGSGYPSGQVTAYQYLNQQLPWSSIRNVDLRQRYLTITSSGIDEYMGKLPGGPQALPPPAGVSQFDYEVVAYQILQELIYVKNVLAVRDATAQQLLIDITVDSGTNGILSSVNNNLSSQLPQLPEDGISGVFITVLQIISNASWALSPLTGEASLPVGVITGLLASASIALNYVNTGSEAQTYSQDEFNQLQQNLSNGFKSAVLANAYAAQAYTQNWGLLQIQGLDISVDLDYQSVWDQYEIFCYTKLAPIYWESGALTLADIKTYGNEGIYDGGGTMQWAYRHILERPYYWTSPWGATYFPGINNNGLVAHFESGHPRWVSAPINAWSNATTRFFGELGASVEDFALNNPGAGYGNVHQGVQYNRVVDTTKFLFFDTDGTGAEASLPPPADRPKKGWRLRVKPTLTRDAAGDILVMIEIENTGTRPLINLCLTDVKLDSQTAHPPTRWTRLVTGRSHHVVVHFSRAVGAPGRKARLRVEGKFKIGIFSSSLPVTLP
jgi:hypothetical protein